MFKRVLIEPGELPRVSHIEHYKPSYEIELSVMDQPLKFQCNDSKLIEAAVNTFGRFPPHGSSRDPLVVQVFIRDSISDNCPGASAIQKEHPISVYNQGHLVLLNIGINNNAVADLRSGFAYAILTPEFAADISAVRYSFIEALPQILLGGRDYVAIHAACVVKDGIGTLLCASSGMGKSTLAFACLDLGYQILAEDVVQVQIMDGGIRLWGIPWKFHLLPDSRRFFPGLPEISPKIQSNGEWKLEIELEDLLPGSAVTSAALGAVVFLERELGTTCRMQVIDSHRAFQRFEPIWSWDIPWQKEYEKQMVGLIEKNTYQLSMNGSPHEAAALLIETINRKQ